MTEAQAALQARVDRARAVYGRRVDRGLMEADAYGLYISLMKLLFGTLHRDLFPVDDRPALDKVAEVGYLLTLKRGVYALTQSGREVVLRLIRDAEEMNTRRTGRRTQPARITPKTTKNGKH